MFRDPAGEKVLILMPAIGHDIIPLIEASALVLPCNEGFLHDAKVTFLSFIGVSLDLYRPGNVIINVPPVQVPQVLAQGAGQLFALLLEALQVVSISELEFGRAHA